MRNLSLTGLFTAASLAVATLVTATLVTGCAPRATGVEARREADTRFRRTTSLVSFDQAKQAFESGDLDRARKEAKAAIARSDGEAQYWTLLGRIELEASQLERAIEAFDDAIERDPNLAEPHYYKGIVQQRWGALDKAIADYERAFELDSSRIAYLLAWAELLVADRRLDEARELLLPKLAHFEHNAAMHELLGDVSRLRGEHIAASRSYERALAIEPSAPLIEEKLLASLFRAGEWQRCLEAARRSRAAANAAANGHVPVVSIDILRHEGRSLAMLGRHEESRTVFAEHVRSYPEDLGAWRDLAIASIEMGDFARARSAADRLLELAAKDSRGLTLRGLVAERSGDLDAAVRWYHAAVGADPKDADAAAALGLALRKIGRCEEADASLRRALELDPGFTLVANALAASDD